MPFIGAAVTAVVGAISAASIGTALIGAGLSIGLGYIAQKFLAPKQQASSTTSSRGTQTNVQYGGAVPRSCIFGWQATAGHLLYWNLYGPHNDYLQLAFAVGDGPHEALAGLYVDGDLTGINSGAEDPEKGFPVTAYSSKHQPTTQELLAAFISDGGGSFFGGLDAMARGDTPAMDALVSTPDPHMWVKFYKGFEDQAADAGLVANANPSTRWTATDTLSGISYVVVTLKYDETLFTGIPQLLFVIKGRLCYDPRKDSTAGGTGTHRWSDKTTWEWTDNPAIALYNYQRGLYLNNELLLGEGVAPIDLLTDYYVTAANVCDELVGLKDGSTEKRYRLACNVGTDRSHDHNMQDILDAMAGAPVESVGAFGVIAGAPQVAVLPFTDGDLIAGKPVKFSSHRSRADLVNAVSGSFTSPDQMWGEIPYAMRTSSTDEAVDGERLAKQLDFPTIFSETQAQRCAEIERRLSRKQKTANMTLGFKFAPLQPGDWTTWNSSRYGNVTYRVESRVINDDETVTLQLTEIGSDVYDWVQAIDQLDPSQPGDLPGTNALATNVEGFALNPLQVPGDNGLTVPALQALWTPVTDKTIVAIIVQYRVQSDDDTGTIKTVRFPNPADGAGLISGDIQANTLYEARVTIETDPPRFITISDWLAQLSPALHIVPLAKNAEQVFLENLDKTIQDAINQVPVTLKNTFATRRELQQQGEALINLAQTLIASGDQSERTMQKLRETVLSAQGASLAAVNLELEALTSDLSAEADARLALATTVGDNTSSIEVLTTSVDGVSVKFGVLGTINGITGGFIFTGIQKLDGSVSYGLEIDGNVIVNGSLTAAKFNVTSLSAISANIGTVTAGVIQSADGKMVIDLNAGSITGYRVV